MPKLSTYSTATPALTDYVLGTDDPGGTPLTRNFTLSAVKTAICDEATASEIRSGAASKYITAANAESASEEVAISIGTGTSVAVDWSTFINGTVTLTGNRTLANPTNGEPGTWRFLRVIQDGTGSRTLAYGGNYAFPGGSSPTLTTAASSVDVLNVYCVSTSNFYVFSALDMS